MEDVDVGAFHKWERDRYPFPGPWLAPDGPNIRSGRMLGGGALALGRLAAFVKAIVAQCRKSGTDAQW